VQRLYRRPITPSAWGWWAARLVGHYVLVAGALSSDPQRTLASGAEIRLEADRVYSG
jgi:hypothetical protein